MRGLARLGFTALVLTAAPAATSHEAEVLQWRESRRVALLAPDGWLNLAGLEWLRAGDNPVEPFGVFRIEGTEVHYQPGDRAVLLNGEPARTTVLRDDSESAPDELTAGTRTATVIRRGDRTGLRIRDTDSPYRRDFRGLEYFPIDASYRVEAALVPHKARRTVSVATVVGGLRQEFESPGILHFRLQDTDCQLEPLISGDRLFLIFRDRTGGKTTYPAGRYLYADLPVEGRTVLDFNKAYNPPCAFTPHATCPLPPRRNRLAVAVEAGEKDYH